MELELVSTIAQKQDIVYMADAKTYSSIKAGGKFEYLVLPKTIKRFVEYLQAFKQNKIDFKVLGNMTNVLPDDNVMKGVFVSTKQIDEQIKKYGNRVVASSGMMLSKLCVFAKENSLSGLEGLFGIPGTVGGAIFGNAGAFGYQICDTLESVLVWDGGKIHSVDAKLLEFSYRSSSFKKNNQIILSATFMLHSQNKNAIMATMDSLMKKRQTSQPNLPSLGSVFKKAGSNPAGLLIENAGLKGRTFGKMQISNKHANFIVNLGGGTSKQFKHLANLVQKSVQEKFGVTLEREVEFLGDSNES